MQMTPGVRSVSNALTHGTIAASCAPQERGREREVWYERPEFLVAITCDAASPRAAALRVPFHRLERNGGGGAPPPPENTSAAAATFFPRGLGRPGFSRAPPAPPPNH